MIAALFAGLGWRGWLALAAAALVIGAIVLKERRDRETGAERERARIERANRSAEDAADDASRRVRACPPGAWNRETGQCAESAPAHSGN